MISAIFNFMPLLGLEGEPKGFAAGMFVVWWVIMLMGSTYVLLWSIQGARQAFHVLMVGIAGFMILYSAIWLFGAPGTVPGTGPRGREPAWVPFLPTSQQAADFEAVKAFPRGWDEPGKKYPGGIESAGEINTIKPVFQEALAARAASQGTGATETSDWAFRATEKGATPDEAALPLGKVYFTESGSHLITGVTIPANDKHPEVTVFAYRDKGQIFYWAAIIFGTSILLFAVNLMALARMEEKKMRLSGVPA